MHRNLPIWLQCKIVNIGITPLRVAPSGMSLCQRAAQILTILTRRQEIPPGLGHPG